MNALKTLYNRTAEAVMTPIQKAHIALATRSKRGVPQLGVTGKVVMAAAMLTVSGAALAQAGDADFQDFREAIEELAGGNFAIGISILALILGALMALGKMTVWPALMGLAIAAVFAIGPYMIVQIFDWFNIDTN